MITIGWSYRKIWKSRTNHIESQLWKMLSVISLYILFENVFGGVERWFIPGVMLKKILCIKRESKQQPPIEKLQSFHNLIFHFCVLEVNHEAQPTCKGRDYTRAWTSGDGNKSLRANVEAACKFYPMLNIILH